MGFDRVGKRPGADAGGIQQEKAGIPEDRASDCTKKEGLTMNIKELDVSKFRDKLFDRMDDLLILPDSTEVANTYNSGLKTMFYATVSMLMQEYSDSVIKERKVEA